MSLGVRKELEFADLELPDSPARHPDDGTFGIQRDGMGVRITVTQLDGRSQSLVISEFNAWRIFRSLALFLGLPLQKRVIAAVARMEREGDGDLDPETIAAEEATWD